jgi:hypothetical protein
MIVPFSNYDIRRLKSVVLYVIGIKWQTWNEENSVGLVEVRYRKTLCIVPFVAQT